MISQVMNKERGTTTKVEVCSGGKNRWFINFAPFEKNGESLGPFASLDRCLRYVYFELDRAKGRVEIVEVNNEGLIFFMPGFKTNYKENNKERVANNVTPINKGKKE
jgi:hypothetical protein|tara:strand:- start:3480 stop:3800 length:321 start_codon:yes stop_codon:yes gene_type:complete